MGPGKLWGAVCVHNRAEDAAAPFSCSRLFTMWGAEVGYGAQAQVCLLWVALPLKQRRKGQGLRGWDEGGGCSLSSCGKIPEHKE